MKRKRFFIFASILLVIATLFLWLFAVWINTKPISMQVWLDGEYVGDTPRLMFVFDDQLHDLELKSDETFTIKYSFRRTSVPKFFLVNPFMDGTLENISIDSDWFPRAFVDGVYLVNMKDPSKRKIIIDYPQPIEDTWGEYEDRIYGLPSETAVSPNGAYALWHTDTAFWLITLDNPNDPQEVFNEYTGRIGENEHEKSLLDMGFSPDGQSIWVIGNDFFSVASIVHPQMPLLHFGGSNFAWSHDGKWLAVYEYENHLPLQILHYQAGTWSSVAKLQAGIPKTFTNDDKYLWMFIPAMESTDGTGKNIVQLVNLESEAVVANIEIEDEISFINGPVPSPNGNFSAFSYWANSTDPNRGNLAIVNNAGSIIKIFSNMDRDYSGLPVWLQDGRKLAVMTVDDDGRHYIEILDFDN